ncbi:hypothetical protein [Cupriavidus necator]
MSVATGANGGKVDEVCREFVEASRSSDDNASEAFFTAWRDLGDRLSAAVYYMTGERMTQRTHVPRKAVYAKMLSSFAQFVELHEEDSERVEIPRRRGVVRQGVPGQTGARLLGQPEHTLRPGRLAGV